MNRRQFLRRGAPAAPLMQSPTAEVVAQDDRATQLLNGRIVNQLSAIQQRDRQNAGQFIPLDTGRVATEIEFAEIWIRRIDVKPLG